MRILAIFYLFVLPVFCFAQYTTKQIDSLLINERKILERSYSSMERILWNKKIIDIAHKMDYQKGEVLGYTNVAQILRQNFELKESLKYLHIAESLSKGLNDDFAKGRLYVEFAQVFNQLGLFETAIKYCDIGISYYVKLRPADQYKKSLRYAYGCRGAYYQEVNPTEALSSLRKAVALDPTPIALSNIAVHYIKFERNQDSAKLYLKKAFELLDSPAYQNNSYHRAVVLLAKGDLLITERRYREVISNYNEVIKLSKHFADPDMVLKSKQTIAWAYRYLDDKENETKFLKEAKLLEDSLAMVKNSGLAVSVDKLFDENRAFQQSVEQQRTDLGLIMTLCLVVLMLIVFLLLRYRNRMKQKIQQKEIENGTLKNLVENNNEDLFKQQIDSLLEMVKENDPKFFIFFQEVYPEFFDKLRAIDPKISNETLKFCALLRLNLTTKDISLYTHIEVRSVQTRKNRLRKQLHISSDVDLNVFMEELSSK
jgi:tetratricopeptide (TPR) repeat protein